MVSNRCRFHIFVNILMNILYLVGMSSKSTEYCFLGIDLSTQQVRKPLGNVEKVTFEDKRSGD